MARGSTGVSICVLHLPLHHPLLAEKFLLSIELTLTLTESLRYVFQLELLNIIICSMCENLCLSLRKRFDEHYRKKKAKTDCNFSLLHYKRTGHSPVNVSEQPVENINCDDSKTAKDIKLK